MRKYSKFQFIVLLPFIYHIYATIVILIIPCPCRASSYYLRKFMYAASTVEQPLNIQLKMLSKSHCRLAAQTKV